MSNTQTQKPQTPAKREEREVSFIPFGMTDQIKLSVAMVQSMIAVPTKSGRTCSETEAMKFVMMCKSKKLNPWEGDAYLIGYDSKDGPTFSLITAHQAFLKRAEVHPEYNGMESGVIVMNDGAILEREGDFLFPGDELVGGWAKVHFKNRKYPSSKKLMLGTFKKNYGQWTTNDNGMIVKCAEADALRSAFPTMLGGLYVRDEVSNDEESRLANAKPVSAPNFGAFPELPQPTGPTPDTLLAAIKEAGLKVEDVLGEAGSLDELTPEEIKAALAAIPALKGGAK